MTDKMILGERVKGAELLDAGVKEVEGKPVLMNSDYRKKSTIPVPLNHYRKMKNYFKEYGTAGVKGYAEAVIRHAKKNNIPVNV